METLQPTLKRGRDVWDKINMPEKEFRRRVEGLRSEMKKDGIDLLLLYGRGADHYANPAYISNFLIKTPQGALAAVPAEGDVTLIVEGFPRDQPAVKSITWIQDIRSCREISKGCEEYAGEKNLVSSTVGLAGIERLMPFYQFQSLSKTLEKCNTFKADHIVEDLRLVKSEREQDQVRRASSIINRAFDFVSTPIFPEMNEKVLEAAIDHSCRLEGAEDIRVLVGKPSEPGWALRVAEDLRIEDGENLIIYLAVAFERYWSEGIRTFTSKSSALTAIESEDFDSLHEVLLAKLIPGKSVAQLYNELVAEVDKSALKRIPRYGLGQGIGLSLAEAPVIAKEDSRDIIKDMCLTLRLHVKDRKNSEFMIGNTIIVSEDKAEILTR